MGVYTEFFSSTQCCLCGSSIDLTGEHKFKASQLRAMFGRDAMTMVSSASGVFRGRHAQGPKSSVFHFKSPLCKICNSSASQKGDHAFDKVHAIIAVQLVEDPTNVFSEGNLKTILNQNPDVFRYFAKLLCCYIADSQGPRLKELCTFAIGESDWNIVNVAINLDPLYPDMVEASDSQQYVAHGGLLVLCDRETGALKEFWNSLTWGPVRYEFGIKMCPSVEKEIMSEHSTFWTKCRDAYTEALKSM